MQIDIKIDPSCREPRLVIHTAEMTEEINQLIRRISEKTPDLLVGFREESFAVLEQKEIIRVYASAGKVFADLGKETYALRMRLYEAEEKLSGDFFVRISHSEIINLRKAEKFELNFAGTICVRLSGGTVTYVSRRYVSKIKKVLGI